MTINLKKPFVASSTLKAWTLLVNDNNPAANALEAAAAVELLDAWRSGLIQPVPVGVQPAPKAQTATTASLPQTKNGKPIIHIGRLQESVRRAMAGNNYKSYYRVFTDLGIEPATAHRLMNQPHNTVYRSANSHKLLDAFGNFILANSWEVKKKSSTRPPSGSVYKQVNLKKLRKAIRQLVSDGKFSSGIQALSSAGVPRESANYALNRCAKVVWNTSHADTLVAMFGGGILVK